MISSKVIETIKSFNESEFKAFGKFVNSPYFNNSKSVIKLYDFIKKFYPDFNNKRFTKENVYRFLFPQYKYKDGTLRKLLSDMQSLAEDYMAVSNLEQKNSFTKKLALLNQLAEKKLDKLFLNKMAELDKINSAGDNFDDDYFKNNFDLEVSRLNFNLGRGRAGFAPITVFNDLQKCTTFLISYALIMSFKLNQDLSVISFSSDSDRTDTLVLNFYKVLGLKNFWIRSNHFPRVLPVIAIYFSRFMIISGYDENDEYYRKFKELVLKNLKRFTRFEKYNLMLFLENSCDEKIYANKSFHGELHDIHKMMLSTGLYKSEDSDNFSLIRFRKMLRISLSIQEFKWAENFINKYMTELPKEFQNNIYYYSQALLYYSKADFDKSLENISKVKSDVYIFKFDLLVLKLQCEYELKYFEESYYSLDSCKHLLKSDKTSPKWMKNRFSGFLHYYNYLLKSENTKIDKLKHKFVSVELLINEIKGSSEILEKEWLLEKFALLLAEEL